ncbi:MAG: hypothetical protein ACI9RU_001361 [Litorivivens sp.]|jgi:hypothetical protein
MLTVVLAPKGKIGMKKRVSQFLAVPAVNDEKNPQL